MWKAEILDWRAGEKPSLTDEDQTESNKINKRFVQENIFYEPLRTWTSGLSNERFFASDEAIIESGIKDREQIRNYDFMILRLQKMHQKVWDTFKKRNASMVSRLDGGSNEPRMKCRMSQKNPKKIAATPVTLIKKTS